MKLCHGTCSSCPVTCVLMKKSREWKGGEENEKDDKGR